MLPLHHKSPCGEPSPPVVELLTPKATLEALVNYLGSLTGASIKVRSQPRYPIFHGVVRNFLYKRNGLYASDFKPLSAAHVLTPDHVVASEHVTSRLLKLRSIALIGTRGKALLFAAHEPVQLILTLLIAMGAHQRVIL